MKDSARADRPLGAVVARIRSIRRRQCRRLWLLPGFWLYLCWCELVLRGRTAQVFFSGGLLLMVLFPMAAAGLIYVLSGILPQRARRAAELVFSYLLLIFYASQLIYHHIFHFFYAAYSVGNGGQVLEFWEVTLKAIWAELPWLLLMVLPPVLLSVFGTVFRAERLPLRRAAALAAAALALHFGCVLLLPAFGTAPMSPYDLYHDTNDLPQGAEQLGLLTAFRLDLQRLIFGFEDRTLVIPTEPTEVTDEPTAPPTSATEPPAEAVPEYNVLSLDFDRLRSETDDEIVQQLHTYFSKQTPTQKNEKTGMFAGCNLIQIVAESFSWFAIDPKLTPTLYKLQTEGFTFSNFYTPYWGVSTSDGEYVTLTGTLPKSGTWSFYDSSDNAMPLTLAQQFKRLGYGVRAYHDHSYTYYHRDQSHPNLGFVFKAVGNGLDITDQWPESDIEMIDVSTDEYMDGAPFYTYYMTVSGHLSYDFESNRMAAKHESEVADLPYSEPVRAYLACQIELDRALALLLERLEDAGLAENTVIVLSADHYPYGLTVAEQSELAGRELDEAFDLYRNACIIYKPGMTPETIDRPCSSLDLLPTLSNLFGLEFDSRLYMGQDIFSDAKPLILFSNRSWLTGFGSFYSVTGEVTSFTGKPLSDELVHYYNDRIADQFLVSEWVLDTDYWRTIFGDNLPPDDAQAPLHPLPPTRPGIPMEQ